MLTVIQGDSLEKLRRMASGSVHLIITSPPYWGLRDYGIPPSIWGGDPECEHEWGEKMSMLLRGTVGDKSTIDGDQDRNGNRLQSVDQGSFCTKCEAWRGVFGLEPSPELYVEHALMIFDEAKRVLRDDGTLWLNLGDSYAGGGNGSSNTPACKQNSNRGFEGLRAMGKKKPPSGLRAGDLVGIPWRVAFALQASGWYLRRDNIWSKDNPMPENVNGWRWEKHRVKIAAARRPRQQLHHSEGREVSLPIDQQPQSDYEDCPGCDKCAPNGGLVLRKGNWRCTTAHEYVFQLSKSDSYFCNAEAAREKSTLRASGNKHRFVAKEGERGRLNTHLGSNIPYEPNPSGRNRRSVWQIPTAPYADEHFATFPPNLVRPIILAASPVRCCGSCRAPFAPVVVRGEPNRPQQIACGSDQNGRYNGKARKDFASNGVEDASAVKARILAGMVEKRVVDHRPTCKCGDGGGQRRLSSTFLEAAERSARSPPNLAGTPS
jgi:DNA modification methylase